MDPVRRSAEFLRILRLPRRTWTRDRAVALAEAWTPLLLSEEGLSEWSRIQRMTPTAKAEALKRFAKDVKCPLSLKPEQAMILHDFVQCRGVFVAAPVGAGKTLATWLLALLAGEFFGAQRPAVFVQANLVEKTRRSFSLFSRYWKGPPVPVQVVSYSWLGTPNNVHALCGCQRCANEQGLPQGLDPNPLILDESDLLRNKDSAISRRFGRFLSRHPDRIVASLSGTVMRKSLRNFSRHLVWCLKGNAPVPLPYPDLEEWCQALDTGTPRDGQRRPPGALVTLSPVPAAIEDPAAQARRAYGDRLAATPGVIVIDESSCDTPLTIRVLQTPDDPATDSAFYQFRYTDATPDGWALGDPLSWLRHGTELGCGFYYRWDPRPPQAWIDARNAWNKTVSEAIRDSQHTRRPLDSEGAVAKAYPHDPTLAAWREIKPTFIPNTVAVPISLNTIAYAKSWLKCNSPALVWVQHDWVGATLSAATGVPFFQEKGCTAGGLYIEDHDSRRSAIMSVHANRRGRDLQAWNRNLTIGPEHSAERWEQQIGRTHRFGQDQPVFYDVLVGCAEHIAAINAAIVEAKGVEETWLKQKILHATWDWSNVADYVRDPSLIARSDLEKRACWTARQG